MKLECKQKKENKNKKGMLFKTLISLVFLVSSTSLIISNKNSLKKIYYKTKAVYHKRNILPQILISKPFQKVYLGVEHESLQKLYYQKERSIKNNIVSSFDKTFVSAKIGDSQKKYKAKIRLKGDFIDHINSSKLSLRVKVSGDHTFLGMKRFSLQHPRTRNFIYEWIWHRALENEGLIGLRYEFIQLILNGKNLGIYALEEHFSKHLIENNRRREGPIFRFKDEKYFIDRAIHKNQVAPHPYHFLTAELAAYEENKYQDPAQKQLITQAFNQLEKLQQGKIQASEAFDIQKFSTFYALMDLFGAHHGNMFFNIRFYYNPVTALFEPIGYDASPGTPLTLLTIQQSGWHSTTIFNDAEFIKSYTKELQRISNPNYLKNLLHKLDHDLNSNLLSLYKEFIEYEFSYDTLQQNTRFIRNKLAPDNGIAAHIEQIEHNSLKLTIKNYNSFPIEIIGLNNSLTNKVILFKNRVTMRASNLKEKIERQRFSFEIDSPSLLEKNKIGQFTLVYKVMSSSLLSRVKIKELPLLDEKKEHKRSSGILKKELLSRQNITVDESLKTITFKQDKIVINKPLILPKGYTILCNKGTQIDLKESSFILSYSPILFLGDNNHPIRITSSDGTGRGLAVVQADQLSIMKYVTFKDQRFPKDYGWNLTGSVTFYESPVDISHCKFMDNKSEDSLNIVRSNFNINHTLFSNTQSDAFDADFCKGSISQSQFIQCSNDGIDISGSEIYLKNIYLSQIGDKALSAGENSQMLGENIEINQAELAIASKDQSTIRLHHSKIENCKVGFTVFQKKPEFGPAFVQVDSFNSNKVEEPYLLEKNSSLLINGMSVNPNHKNVTAVLYGNLYGKSSKKRDKSADLINKKEEKKINDNL